VKPGDIVKVKYTGLERHPSSNYVVFGDICLVVGLCAPFRVSLAEIYVPRLGTVDVITTSLLEVLSGS
jgi:hypothetical protein